MIKTQEAQRAMEILDNYCEENKLNTPHFERKVLWNSLKEFNDLKNRNTDEFIETHLHQWKQGLWT